MKKMREITGRKVCVCVTEDLKNRKNKNKRMKEIKHERNKEGKNFITGRRKEKEKNRNNKKKKLMIEMTKIRRLDVP